MNKTKDINRHTIKFFSIYIYQGMQDENKTPAKKQKEKKFKK